MQTEQACPPAERTCNAWWRAERTVGGMSLEGERREGRCGRRRRERVHAERVSSKREGVRVGWGWGGRGERGVEVGSWVIKDGGAGGEPRSGVPSTLR